MINACDRFGQVEEFIWSQRGKANNIQEIDKHQHIPHIKTFNFYN